MYILSSKITVGQYVFRGVTNCEGESTWDNLTDTFEIELPRLLSFKGKYVALGQAPLFKRGMAVKVELGYDGVLNEVFRGVLRSISGGTVVKLKCEDEMFLLKKGEFTRAYKKVSLKTLMADLLGDRVKYELEAEVELGAFRINKATPAKVLEYLKEHYMIRSWFRGGVLHVGLAYVAALQSGVGIRFDRNVVEHDLEFRLREDVNLLLKGIIMLSNNTKKEIEIGDKEGEQRTFHYYDKDETTVRGLLKAEEERLRYDGYKGSVTLFGLPFVQHGDKVTIVDKVYPEREGTYLVKKVSVKFGQGGYRQEVELETKL
jgi:hypothetical protein